MLREEKLRNQKWLFFQNGVLTALTPFQKVYILEFSRLLEVKLHQSLRTRVVLVTMIVDLLRMRTRDVCLEPRVRYSIGSQKYEFFSSMLHKNDKASKNQSKDKEARCSKAFSARSYRKGVYIQQCISTKLLLPNSPKQAKRRGTTRRNPWQLPEISHQVRLHSGKLSKWKSKRAYQSRLQNWKMFLSKNFTHRNQNHLSCLEPTLSSHIDNESAQRY